MRAKQGSLTAALNGFAVDFREALIEAAQDAIQEQVVKLNEAVSDWTNRPIFRRKTVHKTGRTEVSLEIEGEPKTLDIWRYVDQGTEPHIIMPVKAKRLAFRAGYSARTQPIANAHVGSGRSSGEMVYRDIVHHPGTEAREFIGYAMLEAEESFANGIDAILKSI